MANPPIGFGWTGPKANPPVRATSVPAGVPASHVIVTAPGSNSPHDPSMSAHALPAPPAVPMTPQQVRSMQQFLNNHGFQVAQDGVLGPLTKSAAASFRTNHKGGVEWSKQYGVGTHPATRTGFRGANLTPPPSPYDPHSENSDGPGPSAGPGGGAAGGDAFSRLLAALLKGGGNVGSMLDPASFGDAAAAPALAQAASFGRQVAQNPGQESQNQSDISSWYGLDPNAKSYQLSVLGRLGQARAADATAATSASGNISDIAKALASSIGGSANDGSAGVAQAGANAAGTMGALGEASKQYADEMNPLLAAEARGQMTREKASNQHTLADLQDKLAQASGQATSDRAAAVMGVTDKNNALGQQRFANKGNLLSTLAQMQAADPNYQNLRDAKLQAQIDRINNPVPGKTATPPKTDLGNITAQVAGMVGVGSDHRLPKGMSTGGVAHLVGSALQSAGIAKSDPRYQRLAQSIMATFLDPDGNPIPIPSGWFGPNTR